MNSKRKAEQVEPRVRYTKRSKMNYYPEESSNEENLSDDLEFDSEREKEYEEMEDEEEFMEEYEEEYEEEEDEEEAFDLDEMDYEPEQERKKKFETRLYSELKEKITNLLPPSSLEETAVVVPSFELSLKTRNLKKEKKINLKLPQLEEGFFFHFSLG